MEIRLIINGEETTYEGGWGNLYYKNWNHEIHELLERHKSDEDRYEDK